jgi:hypothetical protein
VSDPGLAAERTRLAWRRTTLSATVVALLAVHQAVVGERTPVHLGALAAVAGCLLAVLTLAHRRITALARGQRVAVGRSPAVLGLLVIAYAGLGLLLI